MQAFTFYASDDKLVNRGNQAGKKFTGRDINLRASELAKQVAAEGDALTLGGICQCPGIQICEFIFNQCVFTSNEAN